jgi:nucleoid DNA-binding protein
MELSFYPLDSSNLTKAQLAEILFEQLGLNKREAKDFIDAFFEIISAQRKTPVGCSGPCTGFTAFKWGQHCNSA